MKNILLIVVLFFILWDAVWWALGVQPLFPWQLQRKLNQGGPGLLLLDVRTPLEFSWFHLPRAQNDPHLIVGARSIQGVPADRPLVIICLTGHRSALAAYVLKKHGFKRVYNLTGGMAGWEIYRLFALIVRRGAPASSGLSKLANDSCPGNVEP